MIDRKFLSVLVGTQLIVLGAGDALAQALPPRGETVTSRPRPEIDPLGVRVRSFLFFPKLEVEEEYNDNIFATENETEDDFITRVIPSLAIVSDWSRHLLQFEVGAESAFFAHNQNEDYTDYFAEAGGRFDFSRESALSVGGRYAHLHEDRDSPDDTGGRNPTEFDRYSAITEYEQQFGRFTGLLGGEFLRFDFEDNDDDNNDDRDRNIYNTRFRLSYEVLPPDYEAFVEFGGNKRDYDVTPDDAGFDRDSYGWNINTGVSLDLGGLVFGEAYVGYFDQTYDEDNNLDDVSGLTYGLAFDWNVTPITTINLFGERDVQETTQDEASAALRSTAGVSVDHELLRSLVLSTGFTYFNDDYEGIDREDDNLEYELSARYFLNRNFYLNAAYGLRRRLSNTDGNGADGSNDFLENIFRISVEAQL